MVTKDEPKDKAIASNSRGVTTAVAGKLFEQVRQKFWHVPSISEGSVRKNYRRVTTQADSQKQIKQNIF